MSYSLRPSTKTRTEAINEELVRREEIKRSKKVSISYSDLLSREEKLYAETAIDLAKLVSDVYGVDSTDSSGQESFIPVENSNSQFEPDDVFEEPSLVWDSSADIDSPEKQEEDSPLFTYFPPGEPETWSSAINKFFPPNCVSTPIFDINRRRNTFSFGDLGNPFTSRFESIAEEEVFESLEDYLVPDDLAVEIPSSNQVFSLKMPAMDEAVFSTRLKNIKKDIRIVESRIEEFTPDDITLNHKDTLADSLQRIRVIYQSTRDKIYDLISDLDEEADKERIENLNKLDQSIFVKFKNNNKAVNDKMVSLLSAVDVQKENDQKEKDKREADEKREKLQLRITKQFEKITSLKTKVSSLKATDSMNEVEIKQHLLDSSKWEKELENLIQSKDLIDIDDISIKADEDLVNEFADKFAEVVDTVAKRISELKLKDNDLKLHTFAPAKSKDTVTYPPKFSGKDNDDVYKFIKDFRTAITSDHVKKSEEINKLLSCLDGRAKDLIGKHHKDLETALENLQTSYGNPQLIWNRKIEKCENELSFRAWGKNDTIERLHAINQMQSFIREAQALAEEHKDLAGEVYGTGTISMIM